MAELTLTADDLRNVENEAEALILEADQILAVIDGEEVDVCKAITMVRDFLDKATGGFVCSIPLLRKLCEPAKKAVDILDLILKKFC